MMFGASGGIINNVIGIFYQPMAHDLNLLVGDIAFHSTITSVVVGVAALFLPRVFQVIGWRPVILIGSLLAFIGMAGMAFFDSLTMFYTLGAIRGLGATAFQMVAVSIIINNWFEEKNGFAMSIASAFSGLVSMVLAPIISIIVADYGWRIGFIFSGILLLIFLLPAIIYPLIIRPEDSGLLPYGKLVESEIIAETNGRSNIESEKDTSISKAAFTAMLLMALFSTMIMGMNQHLSSHGESMGMTIQYSGYMLSAVMFGNIFFKLTVGPVLDRIGSVKTAISINAINVIGLLLLNVGRGAIIPIIASFIFGSIFSFGAVTMPLLTNELFGRQHFGKVFPIIVFISNLGIALSNTLVGYVFDFTGVYTLAFVIGIVFQLFDLLFLYIAVKNCLKMST
jgi:MFS family permease